MFCIVRCVWNSGGRFGGLRGRPFGASSRIPDTHPKTNSSPKPKQTTQHTAQAPTHRQGSLCLPLPLPLAMHACPACCRLLPSAAACCRLLPSAAARYRLLPVANLKPTATRHSTQDSKTRPIHKNINLDCQSLLAPAPANSAGGSSVASGSGGLAATSAASGTSMAVAVANHSMYWGSNWVWGGACWDGTSETRGGGGGDSCCYDS